MLKTIKTTKELNTLELLQHVKDGKVAGGRYHSSAQRVVHANKNGFFLGSNQIGIQSYEDTFTVEIEEPITKATVFETLVEIQKDGQVNLWFDTNIVTFRNAGTSKFYALIKGRLELVWERGEDEQLD